jgi:hypothetical protein
MTAPAHPRKLINAPVPQWQRTRPSASLVHGCDENRHAAFRCGAVSSHEQGVVTSFDTRRDLSSRKTEPSAMKAEGANPALAFEIINQPLPPKRQSDRTFLP